MRVNVFGLGYVGSVTAACLAKAGHEVIGVDIDEEKVAMINDGASPVVEPGLGALMSEVVATRRLRGTISTPEAVRHATIGLICVGTPGGPGGQLRVDALERVGQEIGRSLTAREEPYTVVLLPRFGAARGRSPTSRAAPAWVAVMSTRSVVPGSTVLIPAIHAGAGRE